MSTSASPAAGGLASASFDDDLVERVVRAAQTWSPGASVRSSAPVGKGSSGLTYAVVLDDGTGRAVSGYVKVAPPGLAPVRNRDVLRQAALIEELNRNGSVPVPRLLFQDTGSPPEVPPFFVTEAVDGTCVEPLVDDAVLPDPSVLTARSTDAARTLARLHRFHPAGLRGRGLTDTREQVDLGREIDRWARVFATLDAGDDGVGTDSGLVQYADRCAHRLRASVPEPLAPVVVHGDFRLGNLVCDDSRVRAILDWEIWSLTDPRIDVAWFLMTLSSSGLPSAIRAEAPGLLTPDDALAVYEETSGTVLADLTWFAALSRYRAAAAMALNVKHNRRRSEPNPRIEAYAARLPSFLSLATDLLA
jgi:aminoglycoside phosphotransferase (APT) family kinase protein